MIKNIELFGCSMLVATMSEIIEKVRESILASDFIQYGDVNVATLVNCHKNSQLIHFFKCCNIVCIDGMGVLFGARFLGYRVSERVAGVDLFHELLGMSAKEGFPVFLLGATGDIVKTTAEKVQTLYPGLKIAGYHNGYFWDNEQEVVDEIRQSGAKLLFVAITSPKKENFINRWRDQLGVNFVMGVGGTFDVVAGKVRRAPLWMQKAGLEWLFRVMQEPKRMWKRYLITNTIFAGLLLREKFRMIYKSKRC